MVQCFKLSPNLQKGMEEPTEEEREAGMTAHSKEVKRMEDLLGSIDRNVY